MERDGLLVLKMDVVPIKNNMEGNLRMFKVLIDKQIPKINATVVLHKKTTKMDGKVNELKAVLNQEGQDILLIIANSVIGIQCSNSLHTSIMESSFFASLESRYKLQHCISLFTIFTRLRPCLDSIVYKVQHCLHEFIVYFSNDWAYLNDMIKYWNMAKK